MVAEHVDEDGAPAADGAVGELVSTSLDNRVAPLIRFRTGDLVRLTREPCRCGRTHARQWPAGRKGDEVVVDGRAIVWTDIWSAIESVPETKEGVFQLVRPQREMETLHVRVGYDGSRVRDAEDVRDRLAAAISAAVGVPPTVELVPEQQILSQGSANKISRVAKR
jgi:phenylacetate-CoA ligase